MKDKSNECISQETVAQEVAVFLNKLASQAEKSACRVEEQLNIVCRQGTPTPIEEDTHAQVEREYPTYFSNLKDGLMTIQYSIRQINEIMNRCEI